MRTIICRIAFCAVCEKEQRPWRGSVFLDYSTFQGSFPRKTKQSGTPGFTPHLFMLEKVIGPDCVVSGMCSIHGCGVEYKKSNNKMEYALIPGRWQKFYMPIKEWNALIRFKNDPQYVL